MLYKFIVYGPYGEQATSSDEMGLDWTSKESALKVGNMVAKDLADHDGNEYYVELEKHEESARDYLDVCKGLKADHTWIPLRHKKDLTNI